MKKVEWIKLILYGKVKMPPWNKCEEIMPEADGRYLVVEEFQMPWVGICCLRHGKWDSPRIKYWMNIPKAPEIL